MANGEIRKMHEIGASASEKIMEYNRTHYGAVIKRSRLRLGLNQPQLASLLQVNKNYIANWESGRARPDMNLVPALCKALQISLTEFFGQSAEASIPAPELKAHVELYCSLTKRDRAIADALMEDLARLHDEEMRLHCKSSFIRLFHNDDPACAGTANHLGDITDGSYVFLRKDPLTERADEIITVTGDSMEPVLHAGDHLLVQHTETLSYGETGIFVVNGEGFVKEYRRGGLYSHNCTKYPFRPFLPDDDIRVVGRVLGKVTKALLPTREEQRILEGSEQSH